MAHRSQIEECSRPERSVRHGRIWDIGSAGLIWRLIERLLYYVLTIGDRLLLVRWLGSQVF